MEARAKRIRGLSIVSLILALLFVLLPWMIVGDPRTIGTEPSGSVDSGPAEFFGILVVIVFFGLLEGILSIGNWFLLRTALCLSWRPFWFLQVILPVGLILALILIPGGVILCLVFNIAAPIVVIVRSKKLRPKADTYRTLSEQSLVDLEQQQEPSL